MDAEITTLRCGCIITHTDTASGHGIEWCPMHEAAPALLDELNFITRQWNELALDAWSAPPLPERVRALLGIFSLRIRAARAMLAKLEAPNETL